MKCWTRTTACILGFGMTLALSGCGGGASTVPMVVFKPATTEEAAAPTATETGAATPSGTETAPGAATGNGTLRGRIVLQGSVPTDRVIYTKGNAPKDNEVCGAQAAPDQSVVSENGGLGNVFIYLAKASKGNSSPKPTEPIKFDQKYCVFKPHAIVLPVNVPVLVLNSDSVAHNTHTNPGRNNPFNSLIQPNEQNGVPLTYTRAEQEPVKVTCDIHPWMLAWHLPLDHPFAACSNPDGSFEIADLPPGKHEFRVWHEKGGLLERAYAVTIKPGDNSIELTVPAAKLAEFKGPAPKTIQLSSR